MLEFPFFILDIIVETYFKKNGFVIEWSFV